jgi:hypothetical protein
MKASRALAFAFVVSGCGGKVIFVDGGAGGAGAATSSGHSATGSNATGVVATSVGTSGQGGAGTCLDFGFNGIGSSCADEGLVCSVPYACCGGEAVCQNGVWTFTGPLCNTPCVPCDGSSFECAIGAVCVIDEPGFQAPTYQCFPDPCAPAPLDCGCAATVCEQNFLACQGTKESTIVCDCPNCGG